MSVSNLLQILQYMYIRRYTVTLYVKILSEIMCCTCVHLQTGSKVFHDISWSPANRLIASGNSDRLVRIWDLREKGICHFLTV